MAEDQITAILTALHHNAPDIAASALVSREGLVIASALPAAFDEDRVAALVGAAMNFTRHTAAELSCGQLEQMLISGADGHLLTLQAGDDATLCVLAAQTAKLGDLFETTNEAAQALLPNLHSAARLAPYDASLSILNHAGGLSPADQTAVMLLQPVILHKLPGLLSKFYEVIGADAASGTLAHTDAGALQAQHLNWLQGLFAGNYGPGFLLRQRTAPQLQLMAAIPAVLAASSMAYLHAALPPLLRAQHAAYGENIPALHRLFDLCRYLTDPKYGELFSAFSGSDVKH